MQQLFLVSISVISVNITIMLSKIVLLLSASAILCLHLRTTPEELKVLFKMVDGRLQAEQHEAGIQIRANLVPLGYYTDEARNSIIENVTEAAQPYWKEVSAIEKQAAVDGKNISSCVHQGNNELYALNSSIILGPFSRIQAYYDKGERVIDDSAAAAAGVIRELNKLDARVKDCTNDDCASELQTEATNLLQSGLVILDDSVQAPYEYVQVNLPGNLAQISIDRAEYVNSYTKILDSIKQCIKNL